MKIKFLTLMIVCVKTFVNAQTPKVEWTKVIGGIGNERANSIETDQKGNIIVVGRFQSPTITFDNITLTKSPADNTEIGRAHV